MPAPAAAPLHDVVVVGAGPAGGHLAAQLARQGLDVVLVDQLADLGLAAFSSAGVPLDALQRFGLPAQVVASRCHHWEVIGPGDQQRLWQARLPQAVVLDFAALRRWLADQSKRWGAQVRLGLRAHGTTAQPDGTVVLHLRSRHGQPLDLRSRWVVDATGQARALLGDPDPSAAPLLHGVGVEWLLRVSPEQWQRWSDRLAFFLGSDWIPAGYGWVFPMDHQRLKVGLCRYTPGLQTPLPPLGPYLRQLLQRTGLGQAVVLDRHGGAVRSSIRRREPHRCGAVIGLGDVVSTANLLGGEGIRHALESAAVLAPLLTETVLRQRQGAHGAPAVGPLDQYPGQLRRALGWRWSLSGRIARRTWTGLTGPEADQRLQALFQGLEQQRAEDLSALFFGYRFERYGWRALPYLLGWR